MYNYSILFFLFFLQVARIFSEENLFHPLPEFNETFANNTFGVFMDTVYIRLGYWKNKILVCDAAKLAEAQGYEVRNIRWIFHGVKRSAEITKETITTFGWNGINISLSSEIIITYIQKEWEGFFDCHVSIFWSSNYCPISNSTSTARSDKILTTKSSFAFPTSSLLTTDASSPSTSSTKKLSTIPYTSSLSTAKTISPLTGLQSLHRILVRNQKSGSSNGTKTPTELSSDICYKPEEWVSRIEIVVQDCSEDIISRNPCRYGECIVLDCLNNGICKNDTPAYVEEQLECKCDEESVYTGDFCEENIDYYVLHAIIFYIPVVFHFIWILFILWLSNFCDTLQKEGREPQIALADVVPTPLELTHQQLYPTAYKDSSEIPECNICNHEP